MNGSGFHLTRHVGPSPRRVYLPVDSEIILHCYLKPSYSFLLSVLTPHISFPHAFPDPALIAS